MAYSKTNWQDLPSTTTPVNATNMNKIENALENVYNKSETDAKVDSAISSIEIGGRNLMKGTKDLSGATVRKTIAEDTFNGFTYIDYEVKSNTSYIDILTWDNFLKPEKEQTYTLSFWAKGTGTITSFFYPNCVKEGYNSDGLKTTEQDGTIIFNLTSEWKRHWVTWTTLSNVSGWKNIVVARFNDHAIGQICVAAPKFEKGNKPTDWSPAPEDMYNSIYPVGSIYMSVNSTNPANLFGGTWEQIKDRFLLACGSTYNAGATGGEATHRLTQNEIPNYSIGKIPAVVPGNHGKWENGGVKAAVLGNISSDKPGIDKVNGNERFSGTQYGWEVLTNGGEVAHNNMPPYLAVYMWKRTK